MQRVLIVLGVVVAIGVAAFVFTPRTPKAAEKPVLVCDLSHGGPMESAALKGALTAEDQACLQDRLDGDQATRASRLLLGNAFLSGKTERWARLAEHHLNVFEPNDGELNYTFSLYLSKSHEHEEILLRTQRALDHPGNWRGSIKKARVYGLYMLRAVAAEHLLEALPEASPKAEAARKRTYDFSKEWLGYATQVGKPTDRALTLCKSVATDPDTCTG